MVYTPPPPAPPGELATLAEEVVQRFNARDFRTDGDAVQAVVNAATRVATRCDLLREGLPRSADMGAARPGVVRQISNGLNAADLHAYSSFTVARELSGRFCLGVTIAPQMSDWLATQSERFGEATSTSPSGYVPYEQRFGEALSHLHKASVHVDQAVAIAPLVSTQPIARWGAGVIDARL